MGQAAPSPTLLATSLISAIILGACATNDISDTAATQDRFNDCVSIRNVNGYSVIDNQHLLLRAGVSEQYLITTKQRCSSMRFGTQVGLSFGNNRRICPPFIEHIVTDDGMRCQIDTIENVDSLDAARAMIESRQEDGDQ